MFDSVAKIFAHVLSWVFLIGAIGSVFLVIPIAAYELLSALFQRDHPDELNPTLRR